MGSFFDNMKNALQDGWEASKDFAAKAGSKAQELGEKGVITVEIKKLEFNAERLIKKLGLEAYQQFAENGAESVSANHPSVARILAEIADIKLQIEQKHAGLQ
ncbi:MAG: hypothetical protein LBC72_03905 [Spirochaetaceae bacterium]|jgi:hypothetical protein|nr:hypothetical protein [Spirochaetaceae bacterium]